MATKRKNELMVKAECLRLTARGQSLAVSALDDEDSESEGWESEEGGEMYGAAMKCGLPPPPPPGAASMPVPQAPPPPLAVDTAKVWQYCPPPQDRNELIAHVLRYLSCTNFTLYCVFTNRTHLLNTTYQFLYYSQ